MVCVDVLRNDLFVFLVCLSIDECMDGSANCHGSWADCTNTNGGFMCSCHSGFSGDGVICEGK